MRSTWDTFEETIECIHVSSVTKVQNLAGQVRYAGRTKDAMHGAPDWCGLHLYTTSRDAGCTCIIIGRLALLYVFPCRNNCCCALFRAAPALSLFLGHCVRHDRFLTQLIIKTLKQKTFTIDFWMVLRGEREDLDFSRRPSRKWEVLLCGSACAGSDTCCGTNIY